MGIKQYIIIGLIISVIGLWYWDRSKVQKESYQAGYNQSALDIAAKSKDAEDKRIKEANDRLKEETDKLNKSLSDLDDMFEEKKKWEKKAKELENAKNPPVITQTITVYKTKPAEVCTTVLPSLTGMFNTYSLRFEQRSKLVNQP